MMRKYLSIFMVLCVSVFAVGCGQSSASEGEKTAQKQTEASISETESWKAAETPTVAESADPDPDQLQRKQAHAEETEKIIDELGTVTLDSADAIRNARKAYQKLSADEQKMVENFDRLEKAEEEFNKLKDSRLNAILSGMSKGSAGGYELFFPKAIPMKGQVFYNNERPFVLPYLGRKDDQYGVNIIYNFFAGGRCNLQQVVFTLEDKNYTITFGSDVQIECITSDGNVSENTILSADQGQLELLRKIASCNQVKVTFVGELGYNDFIMSWEDKKAIESVMEAYDLAVSGIE